MRRPGILCKPQLLEGHSGYVMSVCFNHDGSQVASGSDDNTVKVWNAKTGDLVQTLEGHSDIVNSVCFNHDGSQLASGSDDRSVKVRVRAGVRHRSVCRQ